MIIKLRKELINLHRGFPRGDGMETSSPTLRLKKRKQKRESVPWSCPSRGITGNLGPSPQTHDVN